MHTEPGNRNFNSGFGDRTSFRAKGFAAWTREIAILPQFLTIETHFVRKGCAGQVEIAILPQLLAIAPHVVPKGCAGQVEIAILPQVLTIERHFVRKGSRDKRDDLKSQFYLSFCNRTSFRAKGFIRTHENRNFTSVFGDRTSFRAKGLRRTT